MLTKTYITTKTKAEIRKTSPVTYVEMRGINVRKIL